jgi:predicted RNase H-like HicB family nuclease
MKRVYFGAIEKGRKNFGIVFLDFPGCVSVGDTLEEVVANGREALQGHIDVMVDYGDHIPAPRQFSLEQVKAEYGVGKWIALVAIDVTVRKPRKTVSVQVDRELALSLDALKINPTTFIRKAVRNELARLKKSA